MCGSLPVPQARVSPQASRRCVVHYRCRKPGCHLRQVGGVWVTAAATPHLRQVGGVWVTAAATSHPPHLRQVAGVWVTAVATSHPPHFRQVAGVWVTAAATNHPPHLSRGGTEKRYNEILKSTGILLKLLTYSSAEWH